MRDWKQAAMEYRDIDLAAQAKAEAAIARLIERAYDLALEAKHPATPEGGNEHA